jgi:hypothetical protein
VTRFCSIFNQVLQLFPRHDLQRVVEEQRAERHARGSPAGINSARCCSRSSDAPIRCAKSAAAWRVATASWRISARRLPARVTRRKPPGSRPPRFSHGALFGAFREGTDGVTYAKRGIVRKWS